VIPGPAPAGAAEIALRFIARRGHGDWLALVVEPGGNVTPAAQDLAREMTVLGDAEVELVTGARDAPELATRLAAAQGPVVAVGLDDWSDSEWVHLDQLRSRLARAERTALVIARPTFERIMRDAPNFSSWLGGSVWTYQPEATELRDCPRRA
jgi:hypothetical protein